MLAWLLRTILAESERSEEAIVCHAAVLAPVPISTSPAVTVCAERSNKFN